MFCFHYRTDDNGSIRDAGGNEAQEPGQPGTGSVRGYVRCDASADRLSHRVKDAHVLRESEQNRHRRRCEAFPGPSHCQLRVALLLFRSCVWLLCACL